MSMSNSLRTLREKHLRSHPGQRQASVRKRANRVRRMAVDQATAREWGIPVFQVRIDQALAFRALPKREFFYTEVRSPWRRSIW